ncbi:MAG: PepSY domain-containing protein [Candidatus Dormibacteria bacterium]
MKVPITAGAVGILSVAGAAAAIALTTGGANAALPTKVNLVSASSPAVAADTAALSYVNQHYSGTGTAAVLKTEADTEHGVPVYDVTVTAPNGTTYSLSIQTSNDSVLSASPAETQVAKTPTVLPSGSSAPAATQTPEPKQTPDPTQTPEPKQTPDPTQTPEPTATSKDSPDGSGSVSSPQGSKDQQQSQTSSGS